jgi:ribosomal protein S18 acetylase RimI-like enzyme
MARTDHDRVHRLLCACYRWLGPREGWSESQVQSLVEHRGSIASIEQESMTQRWVVAEVGGCVIGMAAVDGHELKKLYIDPEYHRQGIGRVLFKEAERTIRSSGHATMILGSTRTAATFYERMGMIEVGRKRHGLEEFPEHEIIVMEKRLERA